jgi:hypothetical protein
MTAVSDFYVDDVNTNGDIVASPVRTVDGARMMMRGGQNILGVSLMLAAVGLWVMPGSDLSSDVLLMKLALSLTAVGVGLSLAQQGKPQSMPEVQIDTIRREVRLVRAKGAIKEVIKTCKFADLDRAEIEGAHVVLWAPGNVMLAEVPMTDPQSRNSLMLGLMDAGKL